MPEVTRRVPAASFSIVHGAGARHDPGSMKRFPIAIALGLLLSHASTARADGRGWSYLVDKLAADGVDRGQATAAFEDPRVEPFTGLDFSPNVPHEPRRLYRRFLRPASIAAARLCRTQYAHAFEAAERASGVPASVLAAVLFIESGCGRHMGSNVIFYRLARLAMANEPNNVRRNLERVAAEEGRLDPSTAARVRARARYLEQTFYPEVRALFEVADRMGVGPLDIRGSASGAFGAPQFLPTSYLAYGADGDGDGRINLYDPADAAASCARYFVGHGWRPGLSSAQRRATIWQYNRSTAYVDTTLALAARLRRGAAAGHARVATRKHSRRQRLVRKRLRRRNESG
jgi:peptidoglycan lytic transglycosylase B